MKITRHAIGILAALPALQGAPCGADELAWLDAYNVVWNSPSRNSGESMPGGDGSIGLNAWVEDGELLCYVARPDAFEETGALLKSGRIRRRLTPNPFDKGDSFTQELKLRDGTVEVTGRKDGQFAFRMVRGMDPGGPGLAPGEVGGALPGGVPAEDALFREASVGTVCTQNQQGRE